MIKLKNKFAIGCLIQWYEIEQIELYLESVKQSLENIENKDNVIIDLYFNTSQSLEKVDRTQITLSDSTHKEIANRILGYIGVNLRESEIITYSESKNEQQKI